MNKPGTFRCAIALAVVAAMAPAVQGSTTPVRKLVLEEQRIEGKIRRPQMVLIKADVRPQFNPIVVQSAGSQDSFTRGAAQAAIEYCPYAAPFRFSQKRIVNIVP